MKIPGKGTSEKRRSTPPTRESFFAPPTLISMFTQSGLVTTPPPGLKTGGTVTPGIKVKVGGSGLSSGSSLSPHAHLSLSSVGSVTILPGRTGIKIPGRV